MSLRLIRRLVVWATCWIALASVFYAPVEVRVRREWQPEGGHDEWLSKGHVRRPLIELLVATLDYQGATGKRDVLMCPSGGFSSLNLVFGNLIPGAPAGN